MQNEQDRFGAMEKEAMIDAVTADNSAKTAKQVHGEERSIRLKTPDVTTGDVAPDFDLPIYDFSSGTRVETPETFHLQSAAANTPVALVFGSYT